MPSQPTPGTEFRISDISDSPSWLRQGSFGAGSPRRESGNVQYFWLQMIEGNHFAFLFYLIYLKLHVTTGL